MSKSCSLMLAIKLPLRSNDSSAGTAGSHEILLMLDAASADSVGSPLKLATANCSCCVVAGAASVRLVRPGSAREYAGTADVARVSDSRPRCADVEKVVLVLPAAAGVGLRGASITVPSSSVRMAGFRPAVLAADSSDRNVALRASNSSSDAAAPGLLTIPSARHAVS